MAHDYHDCIFILASHKFEMTLHITGTAPAKDTLQLNAYLTIFKLTQGSCQLPKNYLLLGRRYL